MARPLKYFLIAVTLLIVLVVGALTAAVMTFDPNDYRAQIADSVHQKTGRDLAIGDIGLSVFPWLKLDLKQVRLSNAAGFGDAPFAQIAQASVGVELLPLLRERKLVVDGLQLDGLVLNLAKAADGKTNWDDLAALANDEPAAEPNTPDAPSNFKLDDIDIGGIEIRDAAVTYADAVSGQRYQIRDFDLKTGALKPGKPFDIEAAVAATLDAQKLDTQLQLSAHVDPDLDTQDIKLSDLKLQLDASDPQQQISITMVGAVAGNVATQQFGSDDLSIKFQRKHAQLSADADVGGKLKADLKAKRFEIAGLTLDGSASGSSLPGGKQSLSLRGDVSIDQTSGSGELRDLVIKASGLEARTTLALRGLASGGTPTFSGPLSIASFNARELLARFSSTPLQTADDKALTAVSLQTKLDGSAKRIKLDEVLLKLDQTTMTGTIDVRDIATMALGFALKADALDADRYLPPPVTEPKAKPGSRDSAALNATPIPVDALTALNVDGKLDVARLTLKNLKLSDVHIALAGPKGATKTLVLNSRLYGGQLSSTTRITPGARPGYTFKTELQNLALGPFLKDLANHQKLDGIGTIALDLSSSGKTVGDARRALNGSVSLNFKNGAVKGFNLGEMLRRGQALLRGTAYTPSSEPPQTDFASIDFAGQIVNGVLRSDSLDARNPLLRVAGAGQIDLVNETFDYVAKPTIVESSKGQGGRGLEDLGGITVPVHLTGTFTAPKYKIEIADAVRARAKAQVKEQLELRRDEIRERINERLGPGLDALFGIRKKPQPAPTPAAPATETPAAPAAPAETPKDESAPTTP